MLVWLKDLQSNWLSWLAVALTMVVSSAACALAVSMLVATSDADDDPRGLSVVPCWAWRSAPSC